MKHDPIKVYDARWEVDEFDDREVTRLFESTLAYGRLLGVDTVTLTRDGRLGSPRLLEIGINAAVRLGFRVLVYREPISTPQGYFVALRTSVRHPQTMGLVITASHNPAQHVGIKFTVPTVWAIGLDCGPLGGLTKVREIYHSGEMLASVEGGELHWVDDPTSEFVEYSLAAAGVSPGSLAGLTALLDAFHGAAGLEIARTLTAAGVRVLPLRLEPDGNFPSGMPNPTSRGKMDRAVEIAAEVNAEVVLGVDGDGDRVVFGDRRGILSAGFVATPILKALLELKHIAIGAQVLHDPKVNPLALAEWVKLGVEPILFRNGHSQIKDCMKRIGAPFAAEESGHYYHELQYQDLRITSENTLLTILAFLKAVNETPGLLNQLRAIQNQVFTSGEFNYRFADAAIREGALAAVIALFEADGASTASASFDGTDLDGTVVSCGVGSGAAGTSLAERWYSGYFRAATNEQSVVRSYLSASGAAAVGRKLERRARDLMEKQFGGRVVD